MVTTRLQDNRMTEQRFEAMETQLRDVNRRLTALNRIDRIEAAILNLTNRLEQEHVEQPRRLGQGNGQGNPPLPRHTQFTKLEFPKYEGGDILAWLLCCESFFQFDNTPEENKVRMASIHLDNKSFQWHQALVRRTRGRLPLWEEYAVMLQDTFGPHLGRHLRHPWAILLT